jgi:hypothetical protein
MAGNHQLKGVHAPAKVPRGSSDQPGGAPHFECDTYAEVRNEVLGRAGGPEIKSSLASFGDAVTDWFFRSGLQSWTGATAFCLRRTNKGLANVIWWITFAARWKQPSNWAGPDALFTSTLDHIGDCPAAIPSEEVFQELRTGQRWNPSGVTLPSVDAARAATVKELRAILPKGSDTRHLALFPLVMIYWEP